MVVQSVHAVPQPAAFDGAVEACNALLSILTLLLAACRWRSVFSSLKVMAASLWCYPEIDAREARVGFDPEAFRQQQQEVLDAWHVEAFKTYAKWFLAISIPQSAVLLATRHNFFALEMEWWKWMSVLLLYLTPVQFFCLAVTIAPSLVSARTIKLAYIGLYAVLMAISLGNIAEMRTWGVMYTFNCLVRVLTALAMASGSLKTTARLEVVWALNLTLSTAQSDAEGLLPWLLALCQRLVLLLSSAPLWMVVAAAAWRSFYEHQRASDFLAAKASARLTFSMSSLLSKTCDATVELKSDATIAVPSPELAALLLIRTSSSRPSDVGTCAACTGRHFLDFVLDADKSVVGHQLQAAAEELRATPGVVGLAVKELQTRLVDACSGPVSVQLFHICFLGFDDQPRHMLGIVEEREDQFQQQRQQEQHHPQQLQMQQTLATETAPQQLGDVSLVDAVKEQVALDISDSDDGSTSSGSESAAIAANSSCNSAVTDADDTPAEASCWILPASTEWSIVHATLLFSVSWGTTRPTAFRPLADRKTAKFVKKSLQALESADDTILGVEIQDARLQPAHLRTQRLNMDAVLRIWRPQPIEEVEALPMHLRLRFEPRTLVACIEVVERRWTYAAPIRPPRTFLMSSSTSDDE